MCGAQTSRKGGWKIERNLSFPSKMGERDLRGLDPSAKTGVDKQEKLHLGISFVLVHLLVRFSDFFLDAEFFLGIEVTGSDR